MDSFWSILVLVAVILISDQLGGSKKKLPPRPLPGGRRQADAPAFPDIKPPEPVQMPQIEVYVEPESYAIRQPAARKAEERKETAETEARAQKPASSVLTPEQAMSALTWAEILGKPKAYRNGPFRQ